MARKANAASQATPKCQTLADRLGFELVEVTLDREAAGQFLRIYIDKPDGITLDDCEQFHRAIQPQLESLDYDYLEVSSPGVDRPLKRDRDFDRALGQEVEVKLFKAEDGLKQWIGRLTDFDAESFTILREGAEKRFLRKAVALVREVVDMTGVEDVDLTEDETETTQKGG